MRRTIMIEFSVSGMTCGHCVHAVTAALQGVDPAAEVKVDLAAKRVSVRSEAAPKRLEASIQEAGYEVNPVPG
jgi:copper chaperone